MFEKLIDLIVAMWSRLCPAEIVRVYESAAVLRFGKYHRTLEPGLHWKWPVIEEVIVVETCLTTLRLPPQTLTTKNDVSVVVSAIIKYQIVNVENYVTKIWDQHDVLADVTMGAILTAVNEVDYTDLVTTPPERRVLETVRAEVNQYGFKIYKITFTDLGRIRSLRLIQRTPSKINN